MTARTHEKEAIRSLEAGGTIYAIYDHNGNVIGTGTREVCETLLYIIDKAAVTSSATNIAFSTERRPNVRSAIAI